MPGTQDFRPGAVLFDQDYLFGGSFPGENDTQRHFVGHMIDFCLKMLPRFTKTVGNCALEAKLFHITAIFGLAEGNKDAVPVPLAIPIHLNTRRALIIGEYVAVTPGFVLVGDDVVL